jgi:Family of unknown function (DUF5330)
MKTLLSSFTVLKFLRVRKSVWEEKRKNNMGLIRKAIVIGGALMAMPSPPPDQTGNQVAISSPSTSWAYIAAATDTVADLKSFCERKPQVCGTAQYLAVTLEGKAKYSAKIIYEWANDSTSVISHKPSSIQELAAADPIMTGTSGLRLTTDLSANSTLRLDDLVPEWRGSIKG